MSEFAMPAEWDPHEACLMAWPTLARKHEWEELFEEAKKEYAGVANAVGEFEPVLMLVNPEQTDEVRSMCSSRVTPLEIPIDDSWTRDSGPIIVKDEAGHRRGVDFVFNSWGERHTPYDREAAMAGNVLAHLGIEREPSSMVLEGGSITVDGEGTLITTEQCLLNPNRNPQMNREQIEAELKSKLGVRKIIWLPWGHAEDLETDGHVDGVCTYVKPGKVIAQTSENPDSPNYELMAANIEALKAATDAEGRSIEIIELPQLPFTDFHGHEVHISYANFYVANGGIVVPVIGDHPDDAEAIALLEAAFPDREVVGVPGCTISFGGGGPHCITQQIPVEGTV